MWASNEAAKEARSGTHIAIHIDNLQFDEGMRALLRSLVWT